MIMKVPVVVCRSRSQFTEYFIEIPGHPECSVRERSIEDVKNSAQKKLTKCLKQMKRSKDGLPCFRPISDFVDHPEFSGCISYSELDIDID